MRRKPLFPPPVDPKSGKQKRNKGRQRTTILTVNGRVSLRRTWWHSPADGSEAPIDRVLSRDGATVTRGVRELSCRLNNDAASFDKAADNLQRAAQLLMSGEQLRLVVLEEGQRVLAALQADTIQPAFTASDCRVVKGEKKKRREKVVTTRRIVAKTGRRPPPLPPRRCGADQPYKEFKTITFYDELHEHHHILLSRARRTKVGPLLRREATRLKFLEADERIANVDGASWIPPQLDDADLRLHGRGLDFYHLAENVHAARRRVFGDDDATGQTWAATLLHTLKHDGYEVAHEQLLTWLTPLRGRKRKAAKHLLDYVVARREMINYPEFLEHGWQIGSGPTEARCKTSTTRLKRSGARWDLSNAESVAALTNLRDSDQWQLYWAIPDTTKT
jgi:hypothetical protein